MPIPPFAVAGRRFNPEKKPMAHSLNRRLKALLVAGALCCQPVLLAGLAAVEAGAAESAGEAPKDIIADQIRRQGFTCDNALSAERDGAASRPDEAAWILKCDNAAYRVRLIPDMAAQVEPLD